VGIRVSYDRVQKSFDDEGYTLLTDKFLGNKGKLKYICPNGHEHSITWNNWHNGCRCPYCAGNVRLTIEFIRNKFLDEGYILLDNYYENNNQKLKYECPYGHRHAISWGKWKAGRRCPTCKSIRLSGSNNPNWKGGIMCEPYCDIWLDKEYKESIKERDNYQCQNPYCFNKNIKRLSIHHIDYNKKNCHPWNLITLCNSCNGRANKDRKWHREWYSLLICIKYNYSEANYDNFNRSARN